MADYVTFFFELSNNIKLYHWNTTSFARHKASDDLFAKIIDHSDQFMETFMGKYGRPKMRSGDSKLALKNLTDKTVVTYVTECIAHLEGSFVKSLAPEDTDLISIRDDILGYMKQTLYLFTLN